MIQGVQIIILNEQLELLVAKRSPLKQNGQPRVGANRWNFIGGKIDGNEKPIEAALRELKEEANIELKSLTYISEKVNPWDLDYDPFYAYLFVGIINNKQRQDIKLNNEHTSYKFIHLTEVDSIDLLGYTQKEVTSALSKVL